MHKIVYLPLAESDLMDALGYIAYTLDAPKAARDLLAEFDETVQRIAEFPYAHELYRTDRPMKDEIRKVPVKNYVLYYAVFQDRVEIRCFLYGKRDRSRIDEEYCNTEDEAVRGSCPGHEQAHEGAAERGNREGLC